jgi:hypothetical protein
VGFENEFITVAEVARETLAKHPWSLGGGGANDLKQLIEEKCGTKLEELAVVGVGGMSNADDIYIAARGHHARLGVPITFFRPLVVGEDIRDWLHTGGLEVFFPYNEFMELVQPTGSELRVIWPFRTSLWARAVFGGGSYRTAGRPRRHSIQTNVANHQAARERDGGRPPLAARVAQQQRGMLLDVSSDLPQGR